MQKWEYKVLRTFVGTLEAELDEWGAFGWEVVSMGVIVLESVVCLLKRPLS